MPGSGLAAERATSSPTIRQEASIRYSDGSFILPSLREAFGMVLPGWIGSTDPTLVLLYHILLALTSTSSFPMTLNRLAEVGDDLRCERNPPRSMCACTYTL